MTRKVFTLIALLGVFVLGAVTVRALVAQGHGGMMGMMSMMNDCPMMQAMRESPATVLQHRNELDLSEAQIQQLEVLRQNTAPAHMQMVERMNALHQEIARASSGEPLDEAAVRAAFDRMGDLHTEMGVAMLRTQHQTRQVLTPEQREKLSRMGGGMMGMGGMMGGMMENCPMMRGGMMQHHGSSGMQPEGV